MCEELKGSGQELNDKSFLKVPEVDFTIRHTMFLNRKNQYHKNVDSP